MEPVKGGFKAFALTGRKITNALYPGRCPGLGASALSGRVETTETIYPQAEGQEASSNTPGNNGHRPKKGKSKGQKDKRLQATRPERAEAPSPGQRPGLYEVIALRPVRAKALKHSPSCTKRFIPSYQNKHNIQNNNH